MEKSTVSILVPDVSSQGTTRAYIIAQGLQKLGYQVKIWGFMFGEQMYPQPPYNMPIGYIPASNLPNLIKTAFKFAKDIDGDILYVIKPQLTSLGLALLKTWRKKKPIVLDLDNWEMAEHGGDDWRYQGNVVIDFLLPEGQLKNPFHPFYLKRMENLFDRVNGITVSSKFLEYRYGGTYLPNVIDTDFFDSQKLDPQKIREDTGLAPYKLIVLTGTAKPNQGIEEILEALEKNNNPRFKLFLAGGNPAYSEYRQQLYEKWKSWMIITPPQPFLENYGVLAIADIILVPAGDSPPNIAKCPYELIEAMAFAKSIIATNVGEIPMILDDTGYLVPPNNPQAIVDQINYIFDHPEEAEQKAQQARKRCQENYSTQQLTKTLEQVMTLATYSP